jgi:hypothetical protein
MSTFFLQSSFGRAGNFELVTDNPQDSRRGLTHRFRNNDDARLPWIFAGQFFRPSLSAEGPSIVQDRDPMSRRLHVVARLSDSSGRTWLGHFVRDNAPTWSWHPPVELPGSAELAYSGYPVLIESSLRVRASYEVFAPLVDGGFRHWRYVDNRWEDLGSAQTGLGRIDALSLIESGLGRFEMLIRRGSLLEHIRRSRVAGEEAWSAPLFLSDRAAGNPGFIQGRHGRHGNFEVVTPDLDGGLTFLWCNNDDAETPLWSVPTRVVSHVGAPSEGPSDTDAVGLIQSNYGTPGLGNLEIVVRRGGACYFAWRMDQPPWTWFGPWRIAGPVPDGPGLLRRTARLSERLAGCDDLQNAIAWETATGERRVYSEWTRAQKERLDQLFSLLQMDAADLGLRCPNPTANMSRRRRPDGARGMFLTAEEAFDVYAAHVAHAFHLECSNAVSWSLFDLPSAERHELLSSDRFHVRILPTALAGASDPYYPPHISPGRDFQLPYRVQITGGPMGLSCDPRAGYRFIRGRNRRSGIDLLAATEEGTLANVCLWLSQNLGHGGDATDSSDAYFPSHNLLSDRLRAETRVWGASRWTGIFAPAGCHSASNLLHDLARSVNIPLLNVKVSSGGIHQGLAFRWNRTDPRLLHHTDDLYIANTVAPFFSIDASGVAESGAQAALRFFNANFAPLDELTRFGFSHTSDYAPSAAAVYDSPEGGAYGGSWSMTSDHAAYLLERRIQVGSWRFFLEQACGGGFTAAELMRITGAWLPRPFSEIQSHAEACQRAHGGCSTIRAQRDAWHAASGSDAWVD